MLHTVKALVLVLLVTVLSTSLHAKKPPNIVLMMADDLGIGDIGCFGNDTIRTPNIDRIAAEGVRLDHDMAAATVCTPSRAAYQTGRYPIRMGMEPHNIFRVHLFQASPGGLPQSETSIGKLAKSKGYNTGFIGKWHLGTHCTMGDFCHHPKKHGYDYFFGMPISNGKDFGNDGTTTIESARPGFRLRLLVVSLAGFLFAYALKYFGFISMFPFLALSAIMFFPYLLGTFLLSHGGQVSGMVMRNYDVIEQPIVLAGFTDRLIDEGINFINEHKDDEKPFLLVMSWIQVHTALHAIKPFLGRSSHGLYGDEVEEMDWSVGEILKALDTMGLADNTFVHFTPDHGGHLEEKGLHGNQEGGWNGIYKGGKTHGGMEGGFRVPTVARWPGVIPAGSVITVPTSHMDVNPTVAAIVGASLPKDVQIDGKNILPLLRGEPGVKPPHKFLVHYCGNLIHAARYTPGDGTDVYKVFYATHKYLPGTTQCPFACSCTDVNWLDPPLMYNVAKDPSENHPLDIRAPDNQAILQEVNRLVQEHKDEVVPVESQFSVKNYIPRPWLQLCCNFPHCTCKEHVSKRRTQ